MELSLATTTLVPCGRVERQKKKMSCRWREEKWRGKKKKRKKIKEEKGKQEVRKIGKIKINYLIFLKLLFVIYINYIGLTQRKAHGTKKGRDDTS
jgi:hypothetical protein